MLHRIVHAKVLNNAKPVLTQKERISKESQLKVFIRQRKIEAAMKVFQTLMGSASACPHSSKDYYRSVRRLFKHEIKPLLEPTRMGSKTLLEYSRFMYENEEEVKCQRYFLRALKFYTHFLSYCDPFEANGIFQKDFDPDFLRIVVDIFQRTGELQTIQMELWALFCYSKSDCPQDLVLMGMTIANIYFRMNEGKRSLKENRSLLRFISVNGGPQDKIPKIMEEIGQCHELLGDTTLAIKTY